MGQWREGLAVLTTSEQLPSPWGLTLVHLSTKRATKAMNHKRKTAEKSAEQTLTNLWARVDAKSGPIIKSAAKAHGHIAVAAHCMKKAVKEVGSIFPHESNKRTKR